MEDKENFDKQTPFEKQEIQVDGTLMDRPMIDESNFISIMDKKENFDRQSPFEQQGNEIEQVDWPIVNGNSSMNEENKNEQEIFGYQKVQQGVNQQHLESVNLNQEQPQMKEINLETNVFLQPKVEDIFFNINGDFNEQKQENQPLRKSNQGCYRHGISKHHQNNDENMFEYQCQNTFQ